MFPNGPLHNERLMYHEDPQRWQGFVRSEVRIAESAGQVKERAG